MSNLPLHQLREKVRRQAIDNPAMYGRIDFDRPPERFTTDLSVPSVLPEPFATRYRADALRDADAVARIEAYTMLGDTVADPYAALLPKYGFRRLVDMLKLACERGVDAVPNAPPELGAFIAAMEAQPDWIDPELSARGARGSRIGLATVVPFVIRGAFVATFINKYSGLPMALTGALSGQSAEQRVKETASFFTTAALPGALGRFGQGFRAAAMVRLMHSMVRVSLLMRPEQWDPAVFGIPIPQIDQMPAGTMPAFIAAYQAVRENRPFNDRERAMVELCKHQCFLLGLPRDLLHDTPEAIFEAMTRYTGTLRDGYDDETNGALVRATMAAYLPSDDRLRSRMFNEFERRVSKVFFKLSFRVPPDRVARMGLQPSPLDYAAFTAFQAITLPLMGAHMAAQRVPIVEGIADRMLIRRIDELLVSYGHAEYTSNPEEHAVSRQRDRDAMDSMSGQPSACPMSA